MKTAEQPNREKFQALETVTITEYNTVNSR